MDPLFGGTDHAVISNVDNTIRGFGSIGSRFISDQVAVFANLQDGLVSADVEGETLTVRNHEGSVNLGTMEAINGGRLLFENGYSNDGILIAGAHSQIEFTDELLNSATGRLEGNGEFLGDEVFNDGTIAPGDSIGHLTIDSTLFMQDNSHLEIQIGFEGADLLTVTGEWLLGGDLDIILLQGHMPGEFDRFLVGTAGDGFSGFFNNVNSGERLTTVDGLGSFIVNYDTDELWLSNFNAIPEPGSAALLVLLTGVTCMRRRSKAGCTAI